MKKYDLDALTWIFTWVTAALTEKNDLDDRIRLLQRCLNKWLEERGQATPPAPEEGEG